MKLSRFVALVLAMLFLVAAPLSVSAQPTRATNIIDDIPVRGDLPGGGTFRGTLDLVRFRVIDGTLVAVAIHVLQVHVAHARGIATSKRDRVAATVRDVPGVEAQTDQRRIGATQQLVDLAWRLDVRAGVRMERGDESHRPGPASNLVRARGEPAPLVLGEMRIGG